MNFSDHSRACISHFGVEFCFQRQSYTVCLNSALRSQSTAGTVWRKASLLPGYLHSLPRNLHYFLANLWIPDTLPSPNTQQEHNEADPVGKPERSHLQVKMSPFLTPLGVFYSWSKLIQIATEKRSSGENNSVIKYENSGLPTYQDWREKADLSKTQSPGSALTHAASPELMKAEAIKEHKCFSSPHLPQAFQLCSHLSTQKYSSS